MYNFFTFIFILVMFILFLIALYILTKVNSLKERVEAKLRGIKNNMLWNGVIRSTFISYLPLCMAISAQYIQTMQNPDAKGFDYFVPTVMSGLLAGFPIFCFYFLMTHYDQMDHPDFASKYNNLYWNLRYKNRSKLVLLYQPIFFLRRFTFVMLPVVMSDYPTNQLQVLLMHNLVYVVFYGVLEPLKSRHDFKLELFNDSMMSLMLFHMVCFTDTVDLKYHYAIGYSFLAFLCFLVTVNITQMLYLVISNFILLRKQ